MIPVTKLRNGVTFEESGAPYRATKYEHTHMSRGGGTVKVKARNLHTGAMANLTYKSTAYVEEIDVLRKKMQYLYEDEGTLLFMDSTSFEQLGLAREVAGSQANFLADGEDVWVVIWSFDGAQDKEDVILDLDLPPNLVFEIADTGSDEKGNSATNVYKPATLTNGLNVKVPLFMKVGDKVRVDTRTGEYVERVSE